MVLLKNFESDFTVIVTGFQVAQCLCSKYHMNAVELVETSMI
jgi:hypothetical protein